MAYNHDNTYCDLRADGCEEWVWKGNGRFVSYPRKMLLCPPCYQTWLQRNKDGKKKAQTKRDLKALYDSQPTLFDES
jgi:hypothetical protein